MVKEKQIGTAIQRIKDNKKIDKENMEVILDFHNYLEIQDYSLSRQLKYLLKLPKLAEQLGIPFTKAEKKDIEHLVLWLKRRNDINDTTKLDYKILLKRFYKWLNNGEYPECVKFITTTTKNHKRKLPKDMLTEKDIRKLLEASNHPRNRAFISMLWETGARIEELLTLKVGDIEDHEHGLKVVVSGKTGERRIVLIQSVPYINDWLKIHPTREKDDFLWVNINAKNSKEVINYRVILKMLMNTKKKADIKKPINPYHFRHSRATYMANHFTEAQLCEWFGWVQGSKIPATYVHLSGQDIDNAYMQMFGIKTKESEELETELKNIKCPRCGYDNGSVVKFCGRCGMALDMETAMKMKDETNKIDEVFEKLLNDEDVKQLLINKLKTL
jgi:site-specific recombinase XerD